MRVTWLTDLHLNFLGDARLRAFLDGLAAEAADLLLVSGDTAEADSLAPLLDALAEVAPLYFVLGNHDFYGSSIAKVHARARATGRWLAAAGPVALTPATTLVGVDGWGDARTGNVRSPVQLADWTHIADLAGLTVDARVRALRALGDAEALLLRDQLARAGEPRELLCVTHVPPFAEACWYEGALSSPDWQPWFTCLAVGDELRAYAAAHPATHTTVLCGHTHGLGEYRAADNLLVHTGGWPPGAKSYGHPRVQRTWTVA